MHVIPSAARDLLLLSFSLTPLIKIAEFGEAQQAKRKSPDCLHFPLAAQDIDARLNRTAMVNLPHGSGLTNLCVLPRHKGVISWLESNRPA
jgi:hypothetical protein